MGHPDLAAFEVCLCRHLDRPVHRSSAINIIVVNLGNFMVTSRVIWLIAILLAPLSFNALHTHIYRAVSVITYAWFRRCDADMSGGCFISLFSKGIALGLAEDPRGHESGRLGETGWATRPGFGLLTTQNDPKRSNSPDFHRVSHRSNEQLNKAGRL